MGLCFGFQDNTRSEDPRMRKSDSEFMDLARIFDDNRKVERFTVVCRASTAAP